MIRPESELTCPTSLTHYHVSGIPERWKHLAVVRRSRPTTEATFTKRESALARENPKVTRPVMVHPVVDFTFLEKLQREVGLR